MSRIPTLLGFIVGAVCVTLRNATILIVSNPCDIMTAIAAKLAGMVLERFDWALTVLFL